MLSQGRVDEDKGEEHIARRLTAKSQTRLIPRHSPSTARSAGNEGGGSPFFLDFTRHYLCFSAFGDLQGRTEEANRELAQTIWECILNTTEWPSLAEQYAAGSLDDGLSLPLPSFSPLTERERSTQPERLASFPP